MTGGRTDGRVARAGRVRRNDGWDNASGVHRSEPPLPLFPLWQVGVQHVEPLPATMRFVIERSEPRERPFALRHWEERAAQATLRPSSLRGANRVSDDAIGVVRRRRSSPPATNPHSNPQRSDSSILSTQSSFFGNRLLSAFRD